MCDVACRLACLGLGLLLAACGGGGGECADDEGCPLGRYCAAGRCVSDCVYDDECAPGERCDALRGRCVAGCQPTNGGVEACDAIDNDCDGLTDEAFPHLGTPCQNGSCAAGTWVCAASGEAEECDGPLPAADDATCDGLDDDCDGATDEETIPRACPLQRGVCQGALSTCTGATWSTCAYGPQYTAGEDTRCDQLDNDCDGATDEDATFVLAPESGAQATDGLDNNCNGLVDEPGGVMVPNRHYPNNWIDAYEMTVFADADCAGTRYGAASDDYPAGWPAGESATVTLYACSLPGVVPSGHLSWYRAQRACQAQGKRLCNREMFVRACNDGQSQYFPYGFYFAEGQCNDPVAGAGHAVAAGSYESCSIGNGTFDMSGNLSEWVSDDSLAHPGYSPVASWSYDRLICWEGTGCFTADPGWQQNMEYFDLLLDCDVENTRIDAYPRDSARASFGARCCMDGP